MLAARIGDVQVRAQSKSISPCTCKKPDRLGRPFRSGFALYNFRQAADRICRRTAIALKIAAILAASAMDELSRASWLSIKPICSPELAEQKSEHDPFEAHTVAVIATDRPRRRAFAASNMPRAARILI